MKPKKPRTDLAGLSITSILEVMNKKYGEGSLVRASRAVGARITYHSTGCYGFDFATGGGIPRNRITEIRGPYSAGKSTISLSSIREFQRAYSDGLAALVDLEHAFDPKYAASLGVDLDRLVVVNPDAGEQAIDIIGDLLGVSVDLFLVMDSLAALTPTAMIEESAEQQFMGLQARLVNRAFSIFNSRMKKTLYNPKAPSTTLLVLNQLREKIGVMFGNPETTPGGKGKDFYYSLRVRISSPAGERIKENVTRNGQKKTRLIGFVTNVGVDKNKCGSGQFAEATYEFYVKAYKHYPQFSFNNDEVAFAVALYYGIINPVIKGKKVVGHSIRNRPQLLASVPRKAVEQLGGLPKTLAYVYRKCLEAIHADGNALETATKSAKDYVSEDEEETADVV